ncbi:MAG: thermonuclease family protein [Alphaproteobacteria bacterium]|nr:thermonuclease family protein [Alphaproteobacteria bacterium]MBU1605475.1 thermonuclease family protein [Alphaproteobacteria bacterium]
MLVALPLAAFALVFFWDGPPGAIGAAGDDSPARSGPAYSGSVPSAVPSAGPSAGTTDREAARFDICTGRGRVTCVVDGDTIWYRGEKIRIADIDTPEVSRPECPREAELGAIATQRMLALLNAGAFSLKPVDRDRDRYGRLLRTVTRDGASLGAVLVDEGLAEEWGGARLEWC